MPNRKAMSGAAAVAVGLALAVSPTATAAATPCPTGSLCAYVLPHYGGEPGVARGDLWDLLRIYEFDNAVSVFNAGTQCSVSIYTGKGYTGARATIPRSSGIPDLTGSAFHKNVASARFC
ncbi:peptidase inhibitor family I36 protein [Streptomyces sp. NPDC003077]|uniref:peptidase inhibitor family I36 protein n=1 Tax=Streptomyces sp. NPDC003077 TaxID=3154443 RepID=UPI0033B47145